jgi:hypothetical protein
VQRRQLSRPFALEDWLLGFVSGLAYGSGHPKLLRSRDAPALFVWVDNYCRQNPLRNVFSAGEKLLIALLAEPRQAR